MTDILRYTRGDELEPVAITWYEPDGTLYDFSSGWTFRARIGTGSGFLVEKTTGFTGAATAPNLSVNFTTGELDGVASGTYHLDVQATLTATVQTITRTWLFQVLAGVGTDTLPQSPTSLAVLGDLTVGGDITLGGDLIGFPELASSHPAKVSLSTVGNVTTLGVEKTVPEFARLTADSAAVNNSTTLVDVTGLFVPIAVNAVYLVDALLLYNSIETTARIAFGWTTPAGVSGKYVAFGMQTAGTSETTTTRTQDWLWSQAVNLGADTAQDIGCPIRGLLVTGGTAGNLQLQFAQVTATVADTIVLAHSFIRAERIA